MEGSITLAPLELLALAALPLSALSGVLKGQISRFSSSDAQSDDQQSTPSQKG
jgi:hypothetical protein